MKSNKVTIVCLICKNNFMLWPSVLAVGKGKYCSKPCCLRARSLNYRGENSPSWRGGRNVMRNCIECGKTFSRYLHELKRGRGKFCSKPCQAIWESKNRLGKKAGGWVNGNSPLYHRLRESSQYKQWRETVFKRDNFTCVKCGQRGGDLNADHIIPFSVLIYQGKISTLEEGLLYEPLWNINNGRVLCVPCHQLTDSYLNRNTIKEFLYA